MNLMIIEPFEMYFIELYYFCNQIRFSDGYIFGWNDGKRQKYRWLGTDTRAGLGI